MVSPALAHLRFLMNHQEPFHNCHDIWCGGLNPHDFGDPVVLLNATSGSKMFTEPVFFLSTNILKFQ